MIDKLLHVFVAIYLEIFKTNYSILYLLNKIKNVYEMDRLMQNEKDGISKACDNFFFIFFYGEKKIYTYKIKTHIFQM